MWICLILASAFALALYDLSKKASVRDNAVLPVLLVSGVSGFLAYAAWLAATGRLAGAVSVHPGEIPLVAAKSVIVAVSWALTYKALRTLPITVATPIRASAPAFVAIAATFVYGEIPAPVQAAGMLLVIAGYFAFSWAGRFEGIDFARNRAVWFAMGGMAASVCSSLWDKYILQICAIDAERMQFWFQAGIVAVYAVMIAAAKIAKAESAPMEWRWSIPATGILLVVADYFYFKALSIDGVPVSICSVLRRLSVAVTFAAGAIVFRERNLARKALALSAILAGVAAICLSRP